jgi:predicted nucleic acid-binding protein
LTFLDAYALVALVADEPPAAEVEEILREDAARVVLINLAEAVDIAQRVHGLRSQEVKAAIEPLLLGSTLAVAISDEPQAWLAAEIRTKHYDKKTASLSMADCLLLAHGVTDGGPIATSDPPLANVASVLGVEVLGLPDSSGKRPQDSD